MFLSLDMQVHYPPAQKELGPAEDAVWEAALAAALTPALSSAKPSDAFIAHLGRQLNEAARREAQTQQILRIAGVVGGFVSLLGGLVVWLLWRQRHQPQAAAKPPAAAKPTWTWGWKPLSRAHPTH